MSNLRRLVVTLCLMSVLAITASAGIIESPPSAPGETQGPPNSSAQVTGQTETPLAADTFATIVEEAWTAFLMIL